MKTRKKAVFFIAVLLLVSIIFGSGCTDKGNDGGDSRAVKSGDSVKVDYTGKLEDGTVFDTSREDVAKQAGMKFEYLFSILCTEKAKLTVSEDISSLRSGQFQ